MLDRVGAELLVTVTQSLLRATGQNPPGEEAATVAALSAAALELGLDVVETQVEPGRDNVSITLAGGNGPGLLLVGHTASYRSETAGRRIRSAVNSSMAASTVAARRT